MRIRPYVFLKDFFNSCSALFVYEMLITIDQEIEAIWKRRFTVPSLIYLTMRMGTLGYIFLYVHGLLPFFGPQSLIVSVISIFDVCRSLTGCHQGYVRLKITALESLLRT